MTMCMNRVSPQLRLTCKQRRRLEGQMRVRAFKTFYRHSRAAEPNPLVRFVKAIVASAGKIRSKAAFALWCQMRLEQEARGEHGARTEEGAS